MPLIAGVGPFVAKYSLYLLRSINKGPLFDLCHIEKSFCVLLVTTYFDSKMVWIVIWCTYLFFHPEEFYDV